MITDDARVFIVDDDAGVLNSVAFLLRTVGIRAETYSSAQEFLARYDGQSPGCLLLDLRMPVMSGLELQEKLLAMGSLLPIIFLTAHGDVATAVKAVKSGAVDFLQKPFHDQELIDKINRAMQENASIRGALAGKRDTASRIASLTPREHQVLDGVVAGHANKVIASELGVSQRTVEIHRARVMKKMEADSLAHLIQMVIGARNDHETIDDN